MSVRDWWAQCAQKLRIRRIESRLDRLYGHRDHLLDQLDNCQRGLRYIDRQIVLAESDLRHQKRK